MVELLPGVGKAILLAYEPGDPKYSGCDGERPIREDGASVGGDFIFWFNEKYPQPIVQIVGLWTRHFLIFYKGGPFFLAQDATFNWDIWIGAMYRSWSEFDGQKTYAVQARCEYDETHIKQKGTSK